MGARRTGDEGGLGALGEPRPGPQLPLYLPLHSIPSPCHRFRQFQHSSELVGGGAPTRSPSGHSEPQSCQGCPRSPRKQKPACSLSSGRCAVGGVSPLSLASTWAVRFMGSCGEELYSLSNSLNLFYIGGEPRPRLPNRTSLK